MAESISTNVKLVLNPSPEEQVFSNLLLVDKIWKHFDTQDLIRTSAVNSAWCARSRKILQDNEDHKHEILVRVHGESPCRTLIRFNDFLQERGNNVSIIFNGIYHTQGSNNGVNIGQIQCTNCLSKDFTYPKKQSDFSPQRSYGQILARMKFKFIRLSGIGINCPLATFIKFVLRSRADEILELDAASDSHADKDFARKFLLYSELNFHDHLVFPNLEVLGVNNEQVRLGSAALPFDSPDLRKINHFQYNPSDIYCATLRNLPCHAITNLGGIGMNSAATEASLNLVANFKTKIEQINFAVNSLMEEIQCREEHQKNLYQLGSKISESLKSVACTPTFFMFMSDNFFTVDNIRNSKETGNSSKNYFPQLQKIHLDGWISIDVLDWLTGVDFTNVFPKLKEVGLIYEELNPNNANIVHGPINKINKCVFRGVQKLVLGQNIASNFSFGFTPCLLRIFSYIRELDLSKLNLKYDCSDRKFGEIFNEIKYMPFLEQLTIRPPSLTNFNLDHLFLENISAIEEFFRGANMQCMFVYKASGLNHKYLKRITILGDKICTTQNDKSHGTASCYCYSNQLPETFLVSTETAAVISRKRPGFQFQLRIDSQCMSGLEQYGCSSGLLAGGFHVDHLKPYTYIVTPEKSNAWNNRLWNIGFVIL